MAVKSSTEQDRTLSLLKRTIFNGWPPYRKQCPQELWEFWNFRCDLTLEDGLVLKGSRIVIPASMRNQVLQAIHLGHQGENKCILRARESVFWPGISTDIRQMVKNCDLCNKHQPAQPKLPIMQPDLPTRPWEKLGTDILEFNGKKYLMVVDYYSRFPVIRLLNDMTSHTVCNHFTSILAEYGLPSTREHLRPRSQSEITPSVGNTSLPVGAVASVLDPKDTHITNDSATRPPSLAEGNDNTPTPEQSPSNPPCSENQVDLQPASTFAASERTCFQPKSQVTRTGRVTQVPARFED